MPKTYNDLYLEARRELKAAGTESYALEARIICSQAAGKTIEKFMQELRFYASSEVERKASDMLGRRLKGEPLAYISGLWEFYGLMFEISRDVLIPRTDTEVLVRAAVDSLMGKKMDARVLDLCCGSGCVGCAVAKSLPASRVVMADISPEALSLSRRNALRNELTPRVACIEADVRKAPPMLLGSFDMVVCNPPYIPTVELMSLDAGVRDFEPLLALDGGDDGMDYYREILKNWLGILRPNALILFEVGEDQAEDVGRLMYRAGLTDLNTVDDTAGIKRVVVGRKGK